MKSFSMTRTLLLLIMMLMLAACSGFGPVPVKPQKTYLLNDVNPDSVHARKLPLTILVTTPAADAGFNTTAMAYMKTTYQLQYYSQHRWVDTPAHMLVPLMVQSLTQTQHFAHVVAPPYTAAMSFRLDTRLVELFQDFTQKPSVVHLKLRAQLINAYNQHLIASYAFVASAVAPADDAYGQVQAANMAVSDVLGQLSRFVVAHTGPKRNKH